MVKQCDLPINNNHLCFIGLILVNSLQPGSQIPDTMKTELQNTYKKNLDAKTDNAEKVKKEDLETFC